MRAINHALTGAALGLLIPHPVISIPAAFASHFLLDAIPHFDDEKRFPLGSLPFTLELMLDALLCVLLVAVLFAQSPDSWLAASVCAFAATSPDLMWIPRYLRARAIGADPGPKGWIQQLHHKIQWQAWPGGILIEAVWAASMVYALTILM